MSDFVAALLFSAALVAAVGIGEGLRAWAGWQPESSRRAVHVLTGLLVVLAVPHLSEPAWIYALALLFVGVNLVAIGRGIFPGMHGIERRSWGTVTFPLALIFALLTCWTLDPERIYILQVAFLVLAISDPLASFVGTRMRHPGRYRLGASLKSLAGTLAFAGSAVGLVAGGLALLGPASPSVGEIALTAIIIGAVAAAAEALGETGWDNLAIVIAVVVPLVAIHTGIATPVVLSGALLFSGAFGVLSYQARFLSLSGAVAASVLALTVLGLGGLPWMLPALTFFLLSSVLSSLGKERKQRAEAISEKTSRRDSGQVLANGGVAGLLLVAHLFAPHPALYWSFVGAFAAAAADTWGTEIGTFFRWQTRQIVTFGRVEPGESGGVSFPGTLGAVAGAAAVGLSAIPFAPLFPVGLVHAQITLLVIAGGVLASFVDSLIGAMLQGRYRDSLGRITERISENGGSLQLVQGVRWLTNDRVNLACTMTGALIPLGYFLLRSA